MKQGLFAGIVALALTAGACNGAQDADERQDDARATETPGATGTSGTMDPEQRAEPPMAGQEAQQEARQQRTELPESASWLPLTGLVGLLSLGGALGARIYRNRARKGPRRMQAS